MNMNIAQDKLLIFINNAVRGLEHTMTKVQGLFSWPTSKVSNNLYIHFKHTNTSSSAITIFLYSG
jgi:hypothetical protein